MITLTYSGYMNVFTVNSNRVISKIYSQSLLNTMPYGIYCAQLDSESQFLIIGSFASASSTKNFSNGLFVWRVLSSEPWLKHFPVIQDYDSKSKVKKVLLVFE